MNMKTIGSAVVIILAAIVGLFLGAAMNDGLSGSILLAVIAGFVCVIYTIENDMYPDFWTQSIKLDN